MNECLRGNPCGTGAHCINVIGSYQCVCPVGLTGNPLYACQPPTSLDKDGFACAISETCPRGLICYNGVCTKRDTCSDDYSCAPQHSCIHVNDEVGRHCIDPCHSSVDCGPNALCIVDHHKAGCQCNQSHTGNPYDLEIGCSLIEMIPPEQTRVCTTDESCGQGKICRPINGNNACLDPCDNVQCGPNAVCKNYQRRAECFCKDPELQGDPYDIRFGCFVPTTQSPVQQVVTSDIPGCRSDEECLSSRKCDVKNHVCYDPCTTTDPHLQCKCGTNAICKTEHHEATCYCPPGYEGYPDKVCLPIRECGVTFNCPGNLVCLDSHVCGCPPNFFREDDYCFIKSQNCTTTNPCSLNEECVYTGPDSSGFCVCPHGFELLPYGECRAISLCDGTNPCAPGALCRDKPGSYECVCPVDTVGDPYVKGCKSSIGCTSDHDCPVDKECGTNGQCISPCHICGPNAECTVRDHEAICICAHGLIGEAYNLTIGCYPPPTTEMPPEVRTIPPVQDLQVMCLADGVQVSIALGGYDGIIYVKGHSNVPHCRRIVTSADAETVDFKVLFGQCGLIHNNGEAGFVLVVQKHPKLVTYRARAYHIKCVYSTGERTVTLGFNVSMITTSGTIANTGPPPTCLMSICTLDGKEVSSAEIGDDLLLKVDVQPDFIYGGFARGCVARTMEDEGEFQYEVTDENGCATDPSIFGNWEYDPHQKQLMARFNAFKFPSSNNLRFQCNIRVCFGSCPPVNCDGVDAYGRRRRRQVKDEDLLLTDAFKEGALREEIMVQSNAILTFEKRDPQPSAPFEGPRIEDIDHVCLPRLGLILSMIITTLLALVAVAGAISCWLMAYRRRPQYHNNASRLSNSVTNSTMSHPYHHHSSSGVHHEPDYHFSTPEPEPIPDYYNSSDHHRNSSSRSQQPQQQHQQQSQANRRPSRRDHHQHGYTSRSVHGI